MRKRNRNRWSERLESAVWQWVTRGFIRIRLNGRFPQAIGVMGNQRSPEKQFVVVINPASGSTHDEDAPSRIREFLESRHCMVKFCQLDRNEDIARACSNAADEAKRLSATLVACGGDGTINAVAAAALNSGVTLGILPMGTFNYFGRVHDIPADLDRALTILLESPAREVQVGSVNGRPFLVNASIGLYPQLLEDREAWKRRFGRHRFVAIAAAMVSVLHRHRLWNIEIDDGKAVRRLRTPTLLVGNNPLQMARLGLAASMRIGCGELAEVHLHPIGKLAMVGLGLRGALGQLGEDSDIEANAVSTLTVRPRDGRSSGKVKVAIDGEIVRENMPLRFTIFPQSLMLIASREASAEDDPG